MAAIDSIQPLMFSLLALTIALSTTPLTCTALADSTSHSSGEIIVHELPHEWHMWKAEHGKLYQSLGEELQRHMVWHNNMKMIERHNAESATHGYTLKMNHLGDLVSGMLHVPRSSSPDYLEFYTSYRLLMKFIDHSID